MPVRTFNSNEIAKLKQLMNEGIQVTGEVETLREGLRDTVKAIAEEMDMKPAVLNKAIFFPSSSLFSFGNLKLIA